MAGCARTEVRQNGKEGEYREECPAVRRSCQEPGERGHGCGDEDSKEEGVVEPAERLRVHNTELDEQTQREI